MRTGFFFQVARFIQVSDSSVQIASGPNVGVFSLVFQVVGDSNVVAAFFGRSASFGTGVDARFERGGRFVGRGLSGFLFLKLGGSRTLQDFRSGAVRTSGQNGGSVLGELFAFGGAGFLFGVQSCLQGLDGFVGGLT